MFYHPLPLPIGFATIEACFSATQYIPHFVSKVQTNIELISYYDIIYLLKQIDKSEVVEIQKHEKN